jgi:hypothetical protein
LISSKNSLTRKKKKFLVSSKILKPKETNKVRSEKQLRSSLLSLINQMSKSLIFTNKKMPLEKTFSRTDMSSSYKVIDADGSEK